MEGVGRKARAWETTLPEPTGRETQSGHEMRPVASEREAKGEQSVRETQGDEMERETRPESVWGEMKQAQNKMETTSQ